MTALPGWMASYSVPGLSEGQVQPAGVDLRVGWVFRFRGRGVLGEERILPDTEEVASSGGYWDLPPGYYKVRFLDVVEVPLDCVGLCFPRSSLLRMGATVSCAVWDPGYRGRGEALLIVGSPGGVRIMVGARIAQLVLFRVRPRPERAYSGLYQGENL